MCLRLNHLLARLSPRPQGAAPDSVQISIEINVGMLWPTGKVINNNFTNLALLLKSGYNAAKACNSRTQIIIHTAGADSDAHMRWFYDGIRHRASKRMCWRRPAQAGPAASSIAHGMRNEITGTGR